MGSLMDLIVYHENKPYLAYLNPQMALVVENQYQLKLK